MMNYRAEQVSPIKPHESLWAWFEAAPASLRTQLVSEIMAVVPQIDPFRVAHFNHDIYDISPEFLRFIDDATAPREKVHASAPQGSTEAVRQCRRYIDGGHDLNFAVFPGSDDFGKLYTSAIDDDLSVAVTNKRGVFTVLLCEPGFLSKMLEAMQDDEKRRFLKKYSAVSAA